VIFDRRDALTASAIVLGAYLGALFASCGHDNEPHARVRDSLSLPRSVVTSADHEAAEGYFILNDAQTAVVTSYPDLQAWLLAHRGQPIVLSVREYREVK